MATNKRKDSAALFELIDKSTLKVPKHSGSLKIPSWWSSKSNPPTGSGGVTVKVAGVNGNGAGHTNGSNGATNGIVKTVSAPPNTQTPVASPQAKLFEPPPADIPGSSSPSIRPPAPPSGPRFAMVEAASHADSDSNGNGEPSHEEDGGATAVVETQPISEEELEQTVPASMSTEGYAGLGAGRRIFAPQTMSQTEGVQRDWASLQKSRLARAPMWAMVAGGAGVVIVLVLIVYGLMSLRGKSETPKPAASQAGGGGAPLNGPPSHSGSIVGTQGPGQVVTPPPGSQNLQVGPAPETGGTAGAMVAGLVYEPGKAPRSLDLYYIGVLTTSSPEIAGRDADLLAKNGVDISIETQKSAQGHMLYKLFSVKGFNTISEAGPLQKKIVAIGHLLPDFPKTHKAWDDATVIKWSAVLKAARQ